MKNLNAFDWVALLILIIGGVNWGLISLFNLDIVSYIFGTMTMLTRVIYGLVGLSAVYTIYLLSSKTN